MAPASFTPSRLAAGERCLLRTILDSTPGVPTLRSHPLAELGSVFHALLERCVKGQVDRRGTPGEDAATALDELLDQADAGLVQRDGQDAARLREVLPRMTFRRKRRLVLELAERYLSSARSPGTAGGGSGKLRAVDLPVRGTWAEVDFDVPALRLRGRADMVERDGGVAVVRDLKTGRVLDADGQVLPHIERQLRLYGLMASAVWPASKIRLAVDHGEEREVSFGDADQVEAMSWLQATLARVPAGCTFEADALAMPGDGCVGCPFRHVCGAYRAWAPDIWRNGGEVSLPTDTWGQVVERSTAGPITVNLTVRDEAGRSVKIFHARSSDLRRVDVGDHVALFNLRTRDRHLGIGPRRHPLNFYEADPNDPTDRAWALQVFHSAAAG